MRHEDEEIFLMGRDTKVEWADHTFNAWWGCAKVSGGCANCYAKALAKRTGQDVWGLGKPRRLLSDNNWRQPIKWNAEAKRLGIRYRVFSGSMCDVFELHPDVEAARLRLFDLITHTPYLDWMLVTKRPENMLWMTPTSWRNGWPVNVWAYVSCEDQAAVDLRVPHLRKVPALIRGLSVEPLLGPLTVEAWASHFCDIGRCCDPTGVPMHEPHHHGGIDHVIIGGESGAGRRPMQIEWVRDIVEQCHADGVPVFVKQDNGPRPGARGRIPDDLWIKELP